MSCLHFSVAFVCTAWQILKCLILQFPYLEQLEKVILGDGPDWTLLSLSVLYALSPTFFLISLATIFTGENHFVLKTAPSRNT